MYEKYKCMWCEEEYINELVFKKEDACICFGCVMRLAATAVQMVQSNTMDLREIKNKIIEDKEIPKKKIPKREKPKPQHILGTGPVSDH